MPTNCNKRPSGVTNDGHEHGRSRNSHCEGAYKLTRFTKDEYPNLSLLHSLPFYAQRFAPRQYPRQLRSTSSLHHGKTNDFTKCMSLFLRSCGTKGAYTGSAISEDPVDTDTTQHMQHPQQTAAYSHIPLLPLTTAIRTHTRVASYDDLGGKHT